MAENKIDTNCRRFAAVGPASMEYRSTAAAARRHSSTAFSRKCEQCHVVSGRRKLNAHGLTVAPVTY